MARINSEQQVPVTVQPLTAKGKPARIDGSVLWTSDNETVAVVSSTGPTAGMVLSIAPGAAVISATFDADLDVGEVREITMTGAIEVVDAEAVTAEIVFGTPEQIP